MRNAEPIVYVPTEVETAGTELLLRVRGNPDQARQALLERLTGLDPAFGVMTLRSFAFMQTYLLRSAFWVTVALGGLALALLALVPWIGLPLVALAALVSAGATLLSRFGQLREAAA